MKTLKLKTMKTHLLLRSSLFLLISFFSASAAAQISLHGRLMDSASHRPIPRQVLLLQNKEGQRFQSRSDSSGYFVFQGLPPGPYLLKVMTPKAPPYQRRMLLSAKSPSLTVQINGSAAFAEAKERRHELQPLYEQKAKLADLRKEEAMSAKACGPRHLYANYQMPMKDYDAENYQHRSDNGYKEAFQQPLSTLSIDVDRASYSNVRRFLNNRQLPPADAVRVEELINYFPYTYPAPKNGDVFSITRQLTDCPWNDKHQLIRIGIKGKDIEVKNRKTNNLVFLVDVSGSMSSSDKLPLLKSGLRLLVDQMQAEDRITLVAYAGAAGMVLPPTDGKHKEQILEALERLESGGSTAGGAGITLAYKVAREQFLQEGNNRIILATDGDFNVGISSEGELVRLIEKERASGVFLTVLGFGTGNLNDAVMEQLADKGNGNYAYIDNLLEAKKVLVHEMGGTLVTIASDVKIQVEFNPAKVKAYRLVGYENRLLNAEDFNDDKKDAGELGSGHSVTALYEIITTDSDETVPGSDVLKYQTRKSPATLSDEMMTVKFRYKEPGTNSSKLITSVLKDEKISLSEAGEDLQFAAAVAGFGLLLRNSEYKGTANYADIHSMAVKSKGKDEQGYRAEFASLVEIAELLSKRN
jgi:Ca-activated chloride channel homolog